MLKHLNQFLVEDLLKVQQQPQTLTYLESTEKRRISSQMPIKYLHQIKLQKDHKMPMHQMALMLFHLKMFHKFQNINQKVTLSIARTLCRFKMTTHQKANKISNKILTHTDQLAVVNITTSMHTFNEAWVRDFTKRQSLL